MSEYYQSIIDLDRQTEATKIIDLVPHILGLDPSLIGALVESKGGLYLPTSVEPVFKPDVTYMLSDGTRHQQPITILDIAQDITGEKFLEKGDIYDIDGKIIIFRRSYAKLKRFLTTEPPLQMYVACAAVAVVINYLNTLNKHTFVPERQYKLEKLIKPEFMQEVLEKELFENAFNDLICEVTRFVGRDTWNMYRVEVVGTTLVIHKGMDYRIYHFHVEELKKRANYEHDFGDMAGEYDKTLNSGARERVRFAA